MKFKVGDRVRKIKGLFAPYTGTVTIVTETGISGLLDAGQTLKGTFGDSSDSFELIISNPQYELEQLVETANKGDAAHKTLKAKYRGRFEVRYGLKWEQPSPDSEYSEEVRIIPEKPKFEEYTLGMWTVKMVDNMLHIGCKKYKTKEMLLALSGLVHSVSSGYTGEFRLDALRDGVVSEGRIITWVQAEELLAKLEKAVV